MIGFMIGLFAVLVANLVYDGLEGMSTWVRFTAAVFVWVVIALVIPFVCVYDYIEKEDKRP